MSDIVFLHNASFSATIGRDCWHRDKPQPVLVSLQLFTNITLAGETDDVENTIHYGNVYKAVAGDLDNAKFATLDAYAEEACRIALKVGGGDRVIAKITLPKALLQAESPEAGVQCEMEMKKGSDEATSKVLSVVNLRLLTLLGVNEYERLNKQLVTITLHLYDAPTPATTDYQKLFQPVCEHVGDATYLTLEALSTSIARLVTVKMGFSKVTVKVAKPNIFAFVQYPGVTMTRSTSDFKDTKV